MENLINVDTIQCFIAFLVVTLGITALAKARRDASRASKRCIVQAPQNRAAHFGFSAGAMASRLPREQASRPRRAAAHGKESTPC